MKPIGPNGENYWMSILDDATRLGEGPTLTSKGEAFHKFVEYCDRVKLRIGRYLGIARLDDGSEFMTVVAATEL